MNDQRNKTIDKGDVIAALIAAGAQVISTVVKIHQDGIVMSCELALPFGMGQPPSVLLLPKEGKPARPKGKMLKAGKDQRDNIFHEGDEVCSLIPAGIQIVGSLTEITHPQLVRGRKGGGTGLIPGKIVLTGEFILPAVDGCASCLLLPEKDEDADRPETPGSGIVVVQ